MVEFLAVQFVDLEEEGLHAFVVHLLGCALLENGQEFHARDCVEGEDGVLPREVEDGVDLSEVLAAFLDHFFVEEVEAGVGVQLYVEVVGRRAVGFEEQGLVVLVNDEEIVEVVLLLAQTHINYNKPHSQVLLGL